MELDEALTLDLDRESGGPAAGDGYFRFLCDHALAGIYFLVDGRLVYLNRALAAIFGYEVDELIGTDPLRLIHPDDRDLVASDMRSALSGEIDSGRYERRGITRSGEIRHLQILGAVVTLHGRPAIIGHVVDVTERVAAVEELQRQKQLDQLNTAILDTARAVVLVQDADGTILTFNRFAEELTGYAATEVIGRTDFDFLLLPEEIDQVRRTIEATRAGEIPIDNAENYWKAKDGTLHRLVWSGSRIPPPPAPVEYIVGIGMDITDQVETEEALRASEEQRRRQALYDTLTGLPNRTLFRDRLERALLSGRRDGVTTTVLIADIDDMSVANDALGHEQGDAIMREVGARIAQSLRDSDTVARISGDEFAAIVRSPDRSAVERVVTKLQRALAQPLLIDGRELGVSVSLGAAQSPDHGETVDQLLACADAALRSAKRERSGYVMFDSGQVRAQSERLMLVAALRHAIDHGELRLHYQPKLDLAGGSARQVEALVRWERPGVGMVAPSTFIPVAEQTGLIGPLTDWVVQEAVEQARRWRDDGVPIRVAVNLSARTLYDPETVEKMERLLVEHDLDSSLLEMEITESVLMDHPAKALEVFSALHTMGIEIAIDDFGTGYSSLAYLSRLPVEELKIDVHFVKHLRTSPYNAHIVRAVIDLGHGLDLRVVAEGVEDEETLSRLAELRCDLVQGYWLSRPVPADMYMAWLRRNEDAVGT